MTVPSFLLLMCFLMLMGLGAFLVVYSVIRLTRRGAPSELSIPGLKIEIKGPAWLIATSVGSIMVGSPVLFASLEKPQNVTLSPPPSAVQQVESIPDPSYAAYYFVRDVSILDLRAAQSRPWYTRLPGFGLFKTKIRMRPGVLRNYMVVRKIKPADAIHLVYGTSGSLDVRCLTHQANYQHVASQQEGRVAESWDVIADVSAVPVGQEFEIAVEATYWNAFVGVPGDDYTTYSHEQSGTEQLSVILLFPEAKPYKRPVSTTEYVGDSKVPHAVETPVISLDDPNNHTFYWSTASTQPDSYYKLSWKW